MNDFDIKQFYALRITCSGECIVEHVACTAEERVCTSHEKLPQKVWNKATHLTSYVRAFCPDWNIEIYYFVFPIPLKDGRKIN